MPSEKKWAFGFPMNLRDVKDVSIKVSCVFEDFRETSVNSIVSFGNHGVKSFKIIAE
jgi:hypothetical protein